jgi:hypothetical protein
MTEIGGKLKWVTPPKLYQASSEKMLQNPGRFEQD